MDVSLNIADYLLMWEASERSYRRFKVRNMELPSRTHQRIIVLMGIAFIALLKDEMVLKNFCSVPQRKEHYNKFSRRPVSASLQPKTEG